MNNNLQSTNLSGKTVLVFSCKGSTTSMEACLSCYCASNILCTHYQFKQRFEANPGSNIEDGIQEKGRVLSRVLMHISVTAGRGELPDSEKVSKAQLGAFFGAMTLRANCFPPPTRWSDGERKAMSELWPALSKCLPEEVLFLADPEGSIMGEPSDVGPKFSGKSPPDVQLVSALRRVMGGGHLEQEELANLLRGVLPLQGPKGEVSDALLAAFMICSRMNGETEGELNAYCMAFDDELGI